MKYTALTIGPIYKTLQSVKSTKAIWAASYMFSYFMKEIIKKANLNREHVILPYYEQNDLDAIYGVGLFPDRLIVKGEIPELHAIIEDVIKAFAKKVNKDIHAANENDVISYLKEYIRIYHLRTELDAKANIIAEISKLLDTAELKQPVIREADKDFLKRFFEETYYNFLVTSEFDITNRRFPSTIEIANAALKETDLNAFNQHVSTLIRSAKNKSEDETDNQQAFIDAIKKDPVFKDSYRNYQKYITVVQADGDNIGAFITQLYKKPNPEKLIKRFSKNLLQFSKESVELIKNYKGSPIYAGGDDLLFMAPVAHTIKDNNEVYIKKSILTLINEIDEIFHKYFTDYVEDGFDFKSIIENSGKKPGMSYGVSISYYKFPLNEALAEGVNQLFYKAKQTLKKDAVSYAVLKHSGQYFGTTFHKKEPSYTAYTKLLEQPVKDGEYIQGVAYKLEPQQSVLYSIGLVDDKGTMDAMFDNFFKNNFNESIHTRKVKGQTELIPFLDQLKQLFKSIYSENKVSNGIDEKERKEINNNNLNKVYAALRFIGFINDKEER